MISILQERIVNFIKAPGMFLQYKSGDKFKY